MAKLCGVVNIIYAFDFELGHHLALVLNKQLIAEDAFNVEAVSW